MEDSRFVDCDIELIEKQIHVTTRIDNGRRTSCHDLLLVDEGLKWQNEANNRIRTHRSGDSEIDNRDSEIGSKLLNLLISDEFSKGVFQSVCSQSDKSVVINIGTRNPDLANLPWEACAHANWKSLGISPPRQKVAIVRSPLSLSDHWPASEPIKILVAYSSPKNRPVPNVDKEITAIRQGLDLAIGEEQYLQRYKLDVSQEMTSIGLHQSVQNNSPHVLHLVSHGGSAQIELENSSGESSIVAGDSLSGVLRSAQSSLCLIVTTACLSMRYNKTENLASLGEFFINHVPIAIGMQLTISQDMVLEFSQELYYALASSYSVLDAFVYAREKLIQKRPGSPEWIAPVIYRGINRFERLFNPIDISFFKKFN